MPDAPARVLFLNSGILGHRTVGALFREVAALLPRIDAVHARPERRLELDRSRGPAGAQPSARAEPRPGGERRPATLARGVERRFAGRAAHRAAGTPARSVRRPAFPHAGVGLRQPRTDAPDAVDRVDRLHAVPGEPRSRVEGQPRLVSTQRRARRARLSTRLCHHGDLAMGGDDLLERYPDVRGQGSRRCRIRSGRMFPESIVEVRFERLTPIRTGAFTCSSSAATFRARADRNCWMPGMPAGLPARRPAPGDRMAGCGGRVPDGVRSFAASRPTATRGRSLWRSGRCLRHAGASRSIRPGLSGSRRRRPSGDRDAHQRHPRNRGGRANRNPGSARAIQPHLSGRCGRSSTPASCAGGWAPPRSPASHAATPAAYAARLQQLITTALETHDVYAA